MKVILKADVKGIGRKYEVKEVSEGYAVNFLFPSKLAEYASPEAVKKAEILKSAAKAEMELREILTQKQIETLKETKIILNRKANEKGHLFEKVHEIEILEALKSQAKIQIDPKNIKIQNPIKEVGEHTISVEIGKSKGEFKLHLLPF